MSSNDSQKGKNTILIVEDHDVFRDFVKKKLSSLFPDCNFVEAQNGEEALSLAKTMEPDIVITDIRLPRMSGIELTRKIKERIPKTEVIILSLYYDPVYREQAIVAGASAYVLKQEMQSELIPILKKLLPDSASSTVPNKASI